VASVERVNLARQWLRSTLVRELDHVQMMMPKAGEEAARGFYAGLLGLTEVEKPEPMRVNGGVWFAEGLHLSGEDGFAPPRRAHPALRVDDVEHIGEKLAAAGYEVTWDDRWPGVRRFYTRDPFGNRLELLDRGSVTSEPA
jgi:catechol 2,3-dioxygenase-like lactoylglutathione lyase family enzyme